MLNRIASRYLRIWIELTPTDEGGRSTPLDLSSEWPVVYQPRLRVRGGSGALLAVEFVAGPPDPVRPGSGAFATVRLPESPDPSHAELTSEAEFDLIEGVRIVGHGRVVGRQ